MPSAVESEPHTDSPHWPRDAPIRWGRFFSRLAFHGLAVVAIAAHLVLGVLVIAAILGPRIEGLGEWLLAVAWGAGALWQWWSWFFSRRRVLVSPVVIGLLLALLWTVGP